MRNKKLRELQKIALRIKITYDIVAPDLNNSIFTAIDYIVFLHSVHRD